ncbi:hypothetical protein K491DRAFT_720337 [Lophiostoma macrostomum CBS 122681]|uniref:Uncharacterized protein n=1 Tax=Lophiostoma macrostomum CBS 122681 TaxID=1314788 RepID=A0A6A6SWP1_9PLEO|nr:hypothetical protein K491DRAFT_720337 [Lophiostoma macrostomum CBS 122681]
MSNPDTQREELESLFGKVIEKFDFNVTESDVDYFADALTTLALRWKLVDRISWARGRFYMYTATEVVSKEGQDVGKEEHRVVLWLMKDDDAKDLILGDPVNDKADGLIGFRSKVARLLEEEEEEEQEGGEVENEGEVETEEQGEKEGED